MYEIQLTGFGDDRDLHIGADTVFVDQHDGELALFTDQAEAIRFRASEQMLEALMLPQKATTPELWIAAMKSVNAAIAAATARVCACGAPFVRFHDEGETCLGSMPAEPPHDHNDNCLTRQYVCANEHRTRLSLRRSCPACAWRGQRACACCPGVKLERWPACGERA